MIKNRDIIVVGLQAWDERIGSNCKDIALEFSRHNRVLYVNYPMDIKTLIKQKDDDRVQLRKAINKGQKPDLVKINDNMWNFFPKTTMLSISSLSVNFLFDYLNKINNKRFAKRIKEVIDLLDFRDYIIFNDSDMFRSFYLKEHLKPKTYIYYTRDNLVSMPFWKTQGIRIEAQHMKKADFVVANSTYLAKLASQFNPNSYYVGQGCDVSAFKPELIEKIPDDIAKIKSDGKPIVGYVGAILTIRLDIEIISHIAKSRKDWNVVLVGPEDDKFKASDLHQMDNVYFLGSKKGDELPAYIHAFDVAINPQVLNDLTIGNYPRKIDEYLAMGKITVATKTEGMSVFAEHTYLAENKEGYVELIDKGLNENNEQKITDRVHFANEHTWENNVLEIYKRIQEFESSVG
jgi:glycosyltransferase involved in cell wall biosynthesis